ncbi:MAG: hypothetical protein NDI61_11165 [Bdellovibrionaceae bacterium]|nr:hypothetical protein [Pseudobdellovibrionaceae bacterium]
MKTYLPTLQLGDVVEGEIAEQLESGDVIINFRGDLLRVTNATAREFQTGERIALVVVATQPLRFRLNERAAWIGHFDKRV